MPVRLFVSLKVTAESRFKPAHGRADVSIVARREMDSPPATYFNCLPFRELDKKDVTSLNHLAMI